MDMELHVSSLVGHHPGWPLPSLIPGATVSIVLVASCSPE